MRAKSYKKSENPAHFQDRSHVVYLHDDEKDERDEDVDLRMLPGLVVADVVKLLCNSLTAPRAIVKQRDQRLVLR